jgi:hypothetical protein
MDIPLMPEFVFWRGQHNFAGPGDWLWRVAESRLLKHVRVRMVDGTECTVKRTWVRRTRPSDFMQVLI